MNQLTEYIEAQGQPQRCYHLRIEGRPPFVLYVLPRRTYDRSMRQLAAWWTMDHSVIAPHEAALSRLDARP